VYDALLAHWEYRVLLLSYGRPEHANVIQDTKIRLWEGSAKEGSFFYSKLQLPYHQNRNTENHLSKRRNHYEQQL
jgi:hypothetical protein